MNKSCIREPPHVPEVSVTAAPVFREGEVDDGNYEPSLRHLLRVDLNGELFERALELYRSTFTASYELSTQDLAEGIKEGKYMMLVLTIGDGEVRALAIIAGLEPYNRSYCMLDYFVVNPRFRGAGFGSKFFSVLVEYLCVNTPHRTMLLECDNALVSWYGRVGAYRCNIPSSLFMRSAQDDISALKPFTLMAVTLKDDPETFADPERLRCVVQHMRAFLHELPNYEKRMRIDEDGTANSYLIWW